MCVQSRDVCRRGLAPVQCSKGRHCKGLLGCWCVKEGDEGEGYAGVTTGFTLTWSQSCRLSAHPSCPPQLPTPTAHPAAHVVCSSFTSHITSHPLGDQRITEFPFTLWGCYLSHFWGTESKRECSNVGSIEQLSMWFWTGGEDRVGRKREIFAIFLLVFKKKTVNEANDMMLTEYRLWLLSFQTRSRIRFHSVRSFPWPSDRNKVSFPGEWPVEQAFKINKLPGSGLTSALVTEIYCNWLWSSSKCWINANFLLTKMESLFWQIQ